MKIIKRSGKEVGFDGIKIINAISKANAEVSEDKQLSLDQIRAIEESVVAKCRNLTRAASVEEIQDMVENGIMDSGHNEVAKKYIIYRYQHALVRQSNTTDEQIMSLIECNNEEVKQENSNKNPTVNSVQRDYMAGEVSKAISPASRHRGSPRAGCHPFS